MFDFFTLLSMKINSMRVCHMVGFTKTKQFKKILIKFRFKKCTNLIL